jgi:hypothetical protein
LVTILFHIYLFAAPEVGLAAEERRSRQEQIDRLEAKLQMLKSSKFLNLFCVV